MNELTDTAEESEPVVELLFGKKVAWVGVKGIPIVEKDMGAVGIQKLVLIFAGN